MARLPPYSYQMIRLELAQPASSASAKRRTA
jgi:hypothetical protein